MARYADIDVLLEHLTTSNEGNFRTAITQWLKMHQIEDVAPVTHAHWRWTLNYQVICSKCQYVLPSGLPVSDFRFCPYCGAKMDEEEGKQ